MIDLPTALYDAAGTRALDGEAIRVHGIGAFELMHRAGVEAYRAMRRLWPDVHRVAVVCGPGNNGGDGYVLAALAARDGMAVRLTAWSEPHSPESKQARRLAGEAGVGVTPLAEADFDRCDLVVDGILGTGLSRAPEGPVADAINRVNDCPVPVFSLDVPSGLDADTGAAPGRAVRAAATSTFIGLKVGLLTGIGPELAGRLFYHGLGVPRAVFESVSPAATRICRELVGTWLPRRSRCVHKGNQGHVVLIGGNDGMTGALRIASETAARCGAGLVTAATRGRHTAAINVGQPEIMVRAAETPADLLRILAGRQAIGIGPGLGRDAWAGSLLGAALDSNLPAVLDADALNLLANQEVSPGPRVLTPHPGEAARLLGETTEAISRDRIAAARAIAERYGAVCVLKGCGTVVTDAASLYVCDRGNPGMATGGMGDSLTGVIASLMAQGLEPLRAAVCGVWLHASAADREAARHGTVGLLATDLFPALRQLMAVGDE
jgi:hydroxyethylthiazole kinase-like uncharacterized protein yjeF